MRMYIVPGEYPRDAIACGPHTFTVWTWTRSRFPLQMGHDHRHCYIRTLGYRPAPMLPAYYFLVVLCVNNIELIVQKFLFTRFILELSAKETLERLVKKVGTHRRD